MWGGEMWGRIRSKCTIYLREAVFVKPGLCAMTKNQHEREGEDGREAGRERIGQRRCVGRRAEDKDQVRSYPGLFQLKVS